MPDEPNLNYPKNDKATSNKTNNRRQSPNSRPKISNQTTNVQNPVHSHHPIDLSMYAFPIHPSNFYNQPFVDPHMNYQNNQGIFIPNNTSQNHQYSFIPGNIDSNIIENFIIHSHAVKKYSSISEVSTISESEEMNNKLSGSPQQMVFIPNLEDKTDSTFKGINKSEIADNFETLIMPVKIKKEENGQLELLPEADTEHFLTSNDQWNIMHKIGLIKNKQPSVTENLDETANEDENKNKNLISTEIKDDNNKEMITNLKNNTKGFVMVRLSKKITVDENQYHSSNENLMKNESECCNLTRPTKHRKYVKLKLTERDTSQPISQNIINPPGTTTSRFRKLRQCDVTKTWDSGCMTTIDTRVKELPAKLLKIYANNCIKAPDIQIDEENPIESLDGPSCEHMKRMSKFNKNSLHWKLMCSLNNSETVKLHESTETSETDLV